MINQLIEKLITKTKDDKIKWGKCPVIGYTCYVGRYIVAVDTEAVRLYDEWLEDRYVCDTAELIRAIEAKLEANTLIIKIMELLDE